jgi:tRNA(His) 5'-end guanylyltransferase
MAVKDNIGKRMKTYYEEIPKIKLMRRVPVAIRIDGKAFHTFTRGLKKPFDDIFIECMQGTMRYLCQNIQGCVLGYTQSDEITLILIDYQNLNTSAWYDYEVQKLCSVSASMATLAFNRSFRMAWIKTANLSILDNYTEAVYKKIDTAMFDSRCFNIPKEEVTNLIYWRQLDATRNSIQSVGQHYFTQKELHKKSCAQIQDMLMEQKGINWNDLDTTKKRGCCCIKYKKESNGVESSEWIIDNNIPIFKGVDREYIERLI